MTTVTDEIKKTKDVIILAAIVGWNPDREAALIQRINAVERAVDENEDADLRELIMALSLIRQVTMILARLEEQRAKMN